MRPLLVLLLSAICLPAAANELAPKPWYVSAEAGLAASYQQLEPDQPNVLGPMLRLDVGYQRGRFRIGGMTRFIYTHSFINPPGAGTDTNFTGHYYEAVIGPSFDVTATRWLHFEASVFVGVLHGFYFNDDGDYSFTEAAYGGELSAVFDLAHPCRGGAPFLRLSGSVTAITEPGYRVWDGGLTAGYRF